MDALSRHTNRISSSKCDSHDEMSIVDLSAHVDIKVFFLFPFRRVRCVDCVDSAPANRLSLTLSSPH